MLARATAPQNKLNKRLFKPAARLLARTLDAGRLPVLYVAAALRLGVIQTVRRASGCSCGRARGLRGARTTLGRRPKAPVVVWCALFRLCVVSDRTALPRVDARRCETRTPSRSAVGAPDLPPPAGGMAFDVFGELSLRPSLKALGLLQVQPLRAVPPAPCGPGRGRCRGYSCAAPSCRGLRVRVLCTISVGL